MQVAALCLMSRQFLSCFGRAYSKIVKPRTLLGVACVSLIVAACGTDESSAPPSTVVSTAPSQVSTATSAIESSAPHPETTDPEFSVSMVRAEGVTKENKGGQSNVRFVANSQEASTIRKLALECVEHFTQKTKAAYCYAYGSQLDYDVKTPEWTPGWDEGIYGAYRPCWVTQAGQSLNDNEPAIMVEPAEVSYLTSDCPGGVTF